MNQKNTLGLDICFQDLNNPIELFSKWMNEAKKSELDDPNALALATVDKKGIPSVRMVLLKDFNEKGFVFYTNLNSPKSLDLKENPNASMCIYWKSLHRQVRITGSILKVSDKEANNYYNSRSYESRISALASAQSSLLKNRADLFLAVKEHKNKYPDQNNVPRPKYWSGWNLLPKEIEFWLRADNRIHERLIYSRKEDDKWEKNLLYP